MAMPPEAPAPPVLSIVRGEPTPAELAAVLVVMAGRAIRPGDEGGSAGAERSRSEWSAPTQLMRPQLARGPGAWRASGLPH